MARAGPSHPHVWSKEQFEINGLLTGFTADELQGPAEQPTVAEAAKHLNLIFGTYGTDGWYAQARIGQYVCVFFDETRIPPPGARIKALANITFSEAGDVVFVISEWEPTDD